MIKIRLTYADDEEKDIAIEKIKENFEVLNIGYVSYLRDRYDIKTTTP